MSRRETTASSKQVPQRAERLGAYGTYDLHYEFNPEAKFSPRAMAYVYVSSSASGTLTFTQVSAIHRKRMGDVTKREIERRLAVDAVSRAKIRIAHQEFETGEIYTIVLDANHVG